MTSQGIVWVQWVLRKQTDLVLERALLGGEAVAERLELVFVGGGGQLGLDTRLEAGLGLGHELGAVNVRIGVRVGTVMECVV